jgi:Na+(H+)/acetate symporter ActP
MIYHRDPKTLLTVLVAFIMTVMIDKFIEIGSLAFGVILGAFIPLLDGLFWGKDRWDQHPMLYIVVGIFYVLFQYIIGREHRVEGAMVGGIGMVAMQAFLYYTGKADKNA